MIEPKEISRSFKLPRMGPGAMEQAWFGLMALNMLAPPGETVQIIIILSLAMSVVVVPGVRHAVDAQLLTRLTVGSLVGPPLGLAATLPVSSKRCIQITTTLGLSP